MDLASQECVPCRGGLPPVSSAEIPGLLAELPEWSVREVDGEPRLRRIFTFPDFADALTFTFDVGTLAEREGHHPTLLLRWGKVTVTWWTHAIKGLHTNDFIMAARSDAIFKNYGDVERGHDFVEPLLVDSSADSSPNRHADVELA